MVNSSLRNTLARRNHKERAQPLNRQRLGLLEKHKDYVHRARDYKSKQDRIRKLREKAAFRNKDEFYWGMVKGKTKAGVALGDRGNEALSMDLIKVLKTQDAGYVKVQIAKDEKKIAKIRAELEINTPAGPSSEWSAASELAEVEKMAEMGIILRPRETESSKRKGKSRAQVPTDNHVLFVDDQAEFSSYGVNDTSSAQDDIQEETQIDLGWEEAEPTRIKSKTKTVQQSRVDDEVEDARTYRLELLSSLSSYLARVRLLRQAETKLSTTKSHMGKGGAARVKRQEGWVQDDSVPEDRNGERKRFQGKVWKWKMERRK